MRGSVLRQSTVVLAKFRENTMVPGWVVVIHEGHDLGLIIKGSCNSSDFSKQLFMVGVQ